MTKREADESGVHSSVTALPHINARNSPYVPEITRATIFRVERYLERYREFFADAFYYRPDRKIQDAEMMERIKFELFNGGIKQLGCYVARSNENIEGMKDQIIISTPKSLVLFGCEPQLATTPHPAPRHPMLRMIHPTEGLIVHPSGDIFTSYHMPLTFMPDSILEKRPLQDLQKDEKDLWKEHVKRWRLINVDVRSMSGGVRSSIFDLFRWRGQERPAQSLQFQGKISYHDFHQRLMNAGLTLDAGLATINEFITGGKPPNGGPKTY